MRKMTYPKTAGTQSSWYDILADPVKVSYRTPGKTFSTPDILEQCKVIMKVVYMEIDKFDDKDPSRIFISGVGQGANMANACFFAYKGSQPLGGIISYLGMLPLSLSEADKLSDGDYNVLK